LDDAIRQRKQKRGISTLLFADDQVLLLAESQNNFQSSLHSSNIIIQNYDLQISTGQPKVIACYGKQPVQSKIAMNDQKTSSNPSRS